jgi:hypothetical protein
MCNRKKYPFLKNNPAEKQEVIQVLTQMRSKVPVKGEPLKENFSP